MDLTTTDVITDANEKRWWLAPDAAVPAMITNILGALRQNQSALTNQRNWSSRLYGNSSPMVYSGLAVNRMLLPTPSSRGRLRINAIKTCIDTVRAKIAKNKPEPIFLSSGGHYKTRRRAQKLNKFVKGIFEENHVNRLMPRVFVDACINGSAFVHVFESHGRIKMERVLADEIWCDELSAFMGNPTQLFRVKHVEKSELAELFPEHKDLIQNAGVVAVEELGAHLSSPISELVQVCEAWKLPSGPEANDGTHIISVGEGVLLREEYKRDHFPLMHFVWSERPWGYYGQALAEELEPIQLEINRTCATIQESHMVGGTFKVWVKTGSNINTNAINDEIGTIIESDEPPQYITPQLVGGEVYNFLNFLLDKAFQTARITQMSAQGQSPLGPNASGQAIREMSYIENDGFAIVAQNYENAHLDLARLVVDVAEDMSARGVKMKVMASQEHGKGYDQLRLSDIHFGDVDKFVLQLFPVSSLPNTPAARLQTVQELTAAGWINPRSARRLMNFPDLEAAFSLADAMEERIHTYLEKIVDDGEYNAPDSFLDLSVAKELVIEYINQYSCLELEQEKMEMLLSWSDQVDSLQAQAQAATQPPIVPQAEPMPAPVSPLIPNQPGIPGIGPGVA